MIQNYQERAALMEEMAGQAEAQIATVGTVHADGISLIFDGADGESAKHYRCNSAIQFTAGQRVKICKISGTYIVEYPIGAPGQEA